MPESDPLHLIQVYKCFCDLSRLRIIHLLSFSPLCVCHLQKILNLSQVRLSQHLSYMKKQGMVDSVRHQTWMIYHLPKQPSMELSKHLGCLQDCTQTYQIFRSDLKKREKLMRTETWLENVCTELGCRVTTKTQCVKQKKVIPK